MGKEIERKFLVDGYNFKDYDACYFIEQGYLSTDPARIVRVRTQRSIAIGYEPQGFLTVKGKNVKIVRPEFEYLIPFEDAQRMLDMCEKRIKKYRFEVQYYEWLYQIDKFWHNDLVIAEVELQDENEEFSRPNWLGKEVSDDPQYYNSNIIQSIK